DRRDGQGDIDVLPVFPPPNRFKVADVLSLFDALNNLRFLLATILGDEEPDRFSDYLVGGVTERALSSPIPALHDPIQRLADDRIFRGLHNGGHSDTVFLCALALGDVGEKSVEHIGLTALYRGNREFQRELGSVTAQACHFDGPVEYQSFPDT